MTSFTYIPGPVERHDKLTQNPNKKEVRKPLLQPTKIYLGSGFCLPIYNTSILYRCHKENFPTEQGWNAEVNRMKWTEWKINQGNHLPNRTNVRRFCCMRCRDFASLWHVTFYADVTREGCWQDRDDVSVCGDNWAEKTGDRFNWRPPLISDHCVEISAYLLRVIVCDIVFHWHTSLHLVVTANSNCTWLSQARTIVLRCHKQEPLHLVVTSKNHCNWLSQAKIIALGCHKQEPFTRQRCTCSENWTELIDQHLWNLINATLFYCTCPIRCV